MFISSHARRISGQSSQLGVYPVNLVKLGVFLVKTVIICTFTLVLFRVILCIFYQHLYHYTGMYFYIFCLFYREPFNIFILLFVVNMHYTFYIYTSLC